MAAKILDDNKMIKSLKSLFALLQTSPILFDFTKFWRNFLWDRIYRYLSSVKKESDNFVLSIKRAREIRKFHVVVVQRRQRNGQNILFFAVVVGFVVIQKQCYHGNMMSYFSLLLHYKKSNVRAIGNCYTNSKGFLDHSGVGGQVYIFIYCFHEALIYWEVWTWLNEKK